MTIRTITGTVEYADGAIPQNSRLEFYLNGVHIDAVTIAHSPVYTPLDETGDITVQLYPNDTGYGADRYNVDLVTYSDGNYIKERRRVNLGKIYVEDIDGQILQDLLALFSGPSEPLTVAEEASLDAINAAADAAASAASVASYRVPSPFYWAWGGQSNALGSDGGSGTNWITDAGKVFVWVPSTSTWVDAVGRQGLEPFNLDGSNNAGVHAAMALANRFGIVVRMVLAAQGSTEIVQWTGGGYALGVPITTDRTVSASNRVQFKKWTDAVTAASIPQFHAFGWWQGEADLDTPDAVYRSELDYLISQVKSLGTAPVASRVFPTAIHGLYTGEDKSQQSRRTQSLEQYCRENPEKAIYVTSIGLAGRDDDLMDPDNIINHFTSEAYSIAGVRGGAAISQMWFGNAAISDQRLAALEIPASGLDGVKIGSRSYDVADVDSATLTLSIDAGHMRGETYQVSGTSTIELDPNANAALGDGGLRCYFSTLSNSDSVTLVADDGAGTTRTVQLLGGGTSSSTVTIAGNAGYGEVVYDGSRYIVMFWPRSAHSQATIEGGTNQVRKMYSPLELRQAANAAIAAPTVITGWIEPAITTDAEDNALAIQAAIDEASTTGKTVRIKEAGTIEIANPILLPTGTPFRWINSPTTVLQPTFEDHSGFIRASTALGEVTGAYIENLTIRPAIDPGTGNPFEGNAMVAILRDCLIEGLRAENYWGDQGFLLMPYQSIIRGLYAYTDDTSGGSGACRILGGEDSQIFVDYVYSGDDGLQFVPALSGVYADRDIRNVQYIGGVASSNARPILAFIDTALTANITNCGFVGVTGISRQATYASAGSAVFTSQGSGVISGLHVKGCTIDEAMRTTFSAGAHGVRIEGNVVVCDIEMTITDPQQNLLRVIQNTGTGLAPARNNIAIASNVAARNGATPAITVTNGDRNTIRPRIVAASADHTILLSGGTNTAIADGHIVDIPSGKSGVRDSGASKTDVTRMQFSGAGNPYSFAATPATTGRVFDCDLGGMTTSGSAPTLSNNRA